jgi:hypothetical protein
MPENYSEIDIPRFNRILNRLSDASMLDLSRFDLILYGRGGQHKKFYANLKNDPAVEVLWTKRSGSLWFRLLFFAPAEAGFLRVLDPLKLKPLFEEISALSFCEILYIPRELTPQVSEKAFRNDDSFLDVLNDQEEFLYLKAQIDDFIQHEAECYFLYDYKFGPGTAAVLRTVFNGL